nr:MAG TPA: hypothetical protein [Caudoviricetes sp.]
MQSKGYEVNCCAVAACCDLPHRSGTEKHRRARQRQGEARQSDVLRSEGRAWRG